MSDLAATFLGFARDAEASDLILGKELDMIFIQTEAAHGKLGQDKSLDREHGTLWGAICNSVELYQKRAQEATATTLKTQVSKIDYFNKKWSLKYWLPPVGFRS